MSDYHAGCNSRGLVDDSVIICTGKEGSMSTGWWSYAFGVVGSTLYEGQIYKWLDTDIIVFTFSVISKCESLKLELFITKFTFLRTTKHGQKKKYLTTL